MLNVFMFINCDMSWDLHVQCLSQTTYYHISLLRTLHHTFPMNFLLQVYNSYIQPRLDYSIPMNFLLQVYNSYIQPPLYYSITLYGSSMQKNIDLVQRVQNHAAWLIMRNFDYINSRWIDLYVNMYSHSRNSTKLPFRSNGYALWYPLLWHQRRWFSEC